MTTQQAITREEVFRLAHKADTLAECEEAERAMAAYVRTHPEDQSIYEVGSMLSKVKDAIAMGPGEG